MTSTNKVKSNGFTRIELLAVITVMGLLALMRFPGLASHRQTSGAAVCQNNLAQLQRAWLLYAEDNAGRLIAAGRNQTDPDWVAGSWLSFAGPENVNPELNLKKSLLWPYTQGQASIWRCPADPSVVMVSGGQSRKLPRVRSYSMNIWVNGDADQLFSTGSAWQNFRNVNDFNALSPANTWLLLDEHPQSINDGKFAVDMASYLGDPRQARFIDYVAGGHARGAGVAFADGHTEIRRWQIPDTLIPYNAPINRTVSGNADLLWLQERSTRRNAAF